jgi:hypothetical protein
VRTFRAFLWLMPRRASGRIETRANDLSTAFTFPVRAGILGMSSGRRRFGRRRRRGLGDGSSLLRWPAAPEDGHLVVVEVLGVGCYGERSAAL